MKDHLGAVTPQQSTGSRRVQAGQKRCRAPVQEDDASITRKLLRRQLGDSNGHSERRCRRRQDARAAFRNMRLQGELDTLDAVPMQPAPPQQPPVQRQRSKVSEIIVAEGLVVVLCLSGVCVAFDRVSGRRICTLNVRKDEVVRSLFWNKVAAALVTVSVYSCDNFTSLRCRSIPPRCIRNSTPEYGRELFGDSALRWPGWVELDDVNSKVLTFSACDSVYKVYDLQCYRLLYTLPNAGVQEVKISPGILLMIMERQACGSRGRDYIDLRLHGIEDGSVLKEFRHHLRPEHKSDFVELFNDRLLIKQDEQPLEILDVVPARPRVVSRTDVPLPTAFIFLYERNIFLSFREHRVDAWNFQGERITEFEDHELYHAHSHTSNIYITQAQDTIVSFCRAANEGPDDSRESIEVPNMLTGRSSAAKEGPASGCRGSLNVSDVLTGRSIARVASPLYPTSTVELATQAALEDVAALVFDEEHGDIYTGTANGIVHRWSS